MASGKKFYAIAKGITDKGQPIDQEQLCNGIILEKDWNYCKQFVVNVPDARYKGFYTKQEAQAWLDSFKKAEAKPPVPTQPQKEDVDDDLPPFEFNTALNTSFDMAKEKPDNPELIEKPSGEFQCLSKYLDKLIELMENYCDNPPVLDDAYKKGYKNALEDINTPHEVVCSDGEPSKCPRCMKAFDEEYNGYYVRATHLTHCPHCSQRLLWSNLTS